MPMRLGLAAVLTSMMLLTATLFAQSDAPPLTLRVEPGPLRKGVPESFTFMLTNTGAADLRLPEPIVECGGDGSELWLRYQFQPADSSGGERGFGCTADFFRRLPILERAAAWPVLRPGETLRRIASEKELHFDLNPGAGVYATWAEYLPPVLSAADRLTLYHAGILVPRTKLRTGTVWYQRQP